MDYSNAFQKGKSRGLGADNSPVEALNHRKIDSVDSGSRYCAQQVKYLRTFCMLLGLLSLHAIFCQKCHKKFSLICRKKVPKYVSMWLAEGHTPPYFECVLLWRLSTVKSFASKNKYNIWSSSSVACKNAELGCADRHEGWALSITNLEL